MKILIHKPGLLTTIQDDGRLSGMHIGIPQSGFMDRQSAHIANKLVGNKINQPLLEMTFSGPEIEFTDEVMFAITGADMTPTLNNKLIKCYESYESKKGDVLRLGFAKCGTRAYLAFSGMIDVSEMYGSFSTYLPGKFGGKDGKQLNKGDVISIQSNSIKQKTERIDIDTLKIDHNEVQSIKILKGPEFSILDADCIKLLKNQLFTINSESNRVGYRLKGHSILRNPINSIISSPTMRGVVQLPNNGLPIVLMSDSPTIGGYPRIGVCTSQSCDLLAQLKTNDQIQFDIID